MTGVTSVPRSQPEVKQQTRQFVQQAIEQRRPENPGQVDQNRLSEELLEEVGKSAKADSLDPNDSQGLNALLGALSENFLEQRLGPEEGSQAGGQQEGKKERIVDWNPKVKKGEIIGAHDPIGDIVVRERSQPGSQGAGQGRGSGKNKGAGGSGAARPPQAVPPNQKAQTPQSVHPGAQAGKANHGPKNDQEQNSGTQTDDVQLSSESQQMAQQMAQQGLQVPGVTDNQKAQNATKPDSSGERIVEQGEVTTRCGGVSQTVDVTPAGRLQPGDYLRTYRKLDDIPDDLTVGFKRKTGEEAVEEYKQKQERGEVARPLTVQQLEQLRHPTGNEK